MKEFDLIDKYFNNSLSPKEQLLFNELLQNNDAFKAEFIFQKDLKKAIINSQQSDLKSTLRNFENNIQNKPKVITLPKQWLIAASIILIIGLGSIFIKTSYYPSSEKLYAKNFEPYRNIIDPIVRGEKTNTIEHSAFSAYENGDYHKAINLFNSVKNQNPAYIPFYKAMCYLSLENTSEAINLLLPITKSFSNEENNFNELANWYLGLAYLKNDEKEKAISQFSLIVNQPTNIANKERAEKILNYLK